MSDRFTLNLDNADIHAMQVGDGNVQYNAFTGHEFDAAARSSNLHLVAAALDEVEGSRELAQALRRLAETTPEEMADAKEPEELPTLLQRAMEALRASERGLAAYNKLPEPVRSWIEASMGLT